MKVVGTRLAMDDNGDFIILGKDDCIDPRIARLNSIFARQRADIKAAAAREICKAALIVAATAAAMLIVWRGKGSKRFVGDGRDRPLLRR